MATPASRPPRPLRGDHVRLTRRRVVDAANALFLAKGYTGTTIEAIAQAAGVSVQTVYNSVGSKAAVLKAVYDTTLAGDDEPVAVADRPAFRSILTAASARVSLARYAALSRELGERAVPLVAMILAEAGTPDVRELADTAEHQRALGSAAVACLVADRFGLAGRLTPDEAADILWALTGPETMIRLVSKRGWSWDRYEAWLASAMADGIVGRSRSTRAGRS